MLWSHQESIKFLSDMRTVKNPYLQERNSFRNNLHLYEFLFNQSGAGGSCHGISFISLQCCESSDGEMLNETFTKNKTII